MKLKGSHKINIFFSVQKFGKHYLGVAELCMCIYSNIHVEDAMCGLNDAKNTAENASH